MNAIITAAVLGLLELSTPAPAGAPLPATSPAAAEGSAVSAQPAPPSAADSVVAAAFGKDFGTAPLDLKGTAATAPTFAGPDWGNLVAPALALLGLAALAFGLLRRRAASPRHIRVVESASLGPKRSLVIADVLGDRLVLAVSEAGVTVLTSREAPPPEPEPLVVPDLEPVTRPIPRMGFFARTFGKPPAPMRFDELLGESVEDQELRAKLAAGFRGTVP